jgi:hypothetical protein
MSDQTFSGVWVSDVPFDENDGASGDTLLTIDIPDALFQEYEWVEEGKSRRESLIAARLLNEFGPPTPIREDES